VLVPPRDVEALAAALGTLLRDPLLRERMGDSGRERAVQFGWENITGKVEDYYGFVIRRLAARNALPSGFSADVPAAPSRAPGLWSKTDGSEGASDTTIEAASEATNA
jgi:D-inositol-3-phosphate glycosyltransferase